MKIYLFGKTFHCWKYCFEMTPEIADVGRIELSWSMDMDLKASKRGRWGLGGEGWGGGGVGVSAMWKIPK